MPAQNAAAPTIMMSPSAWRGSSAGVGKPNATIMPAKDRPKPDPLRQAEAIDRKEDARAGHDEERREIDEQHGAGRGRVVETVIDQDELGAEQRTAGQPGPQRVVAREQRNAAQLAP